MDAENIIYIVVTIVIFIVSMLSKPKKKPKPTPENLDEVEYTLNEFEKLLERKQEYVEADIEGDDSEEKAIEQQSIIMGKAVNKLYDKPKEKQQDKKEQIVEEEVHEDGFDVKSAIIYSSILERKKTRR